MEKFHEEITLTREEVDALEEAIESLRDYGRVHFKFSGGQLDIDCDYFANLREKYKSEEKI